jgi:hypothetical protein
MEKNVEERWNYSNITITDDKIHDFRGFYINGGFNLEMTDKFSIAGSFRTPYIKRSDSKSLTRYLSPGGNTDIRIDSSGNNSYYQPFILGFGLQYIFSEHFRTAADVYFFNWADYKIDYYDEEITRNFKNVFKIGAGIEYSTPIKLLGIDIQTFYRIGAIYDPQPMKVLDSTYMGLTLGAGIQWRRYFLDFGVLFSKESGSGHDLDSQVFIVTLGYK